MTAVASHNIAATPSAAAVVFNNLSRNIVVNILLNRVS
jgi:hypothetical protein